MAARVRRNKVRPDSPDLPDMLDEPPGALSNGALWECVRADDSADLPESLADVHLIESVLTGVDLRGRRITGLRCRDVVFANCDLSGALLDSDLTQASFRDVRADGLALHGSTLDGVRGAASLTGARIGSDQVLSLGAALLAAMGVQMGDR